MCYFIMYSPLTNLFCFGSFVIRMSNRFCGKKSEFYYNILKVFFFLLTKSVLCSVDTQWQLGVDFCSFVKKDDIKRKPIYFYVKNANSSMQLHERKNVFVMYIFQNKKHRRNHVKGLGVLHEQTLIGPLICQNSQRRFSGRGFMHIYAFCLTRERYLFIVGHLMVCLELSKEFSFKRESLHFTLKVIWT